MYTVSIYQQPSALPLTLAEVKLFLRISHDEEDDLLTQLIETAADSCEKYLSKSLITKKYKMIFEDRLPLKIVLPYQPIQFIDSIKLIDREDVETLISSDEYIFNIENGKIALDSGYTSHKAEIIYTSGYGNLSSDVPGTIKQGLLIHINKLYEDRTGYGLMPKGSIYLYNICKNKRL